VSGRVRSVDGPVAEALQVPVDGGALRGGVWRSNAGQPVVVAVHGITLNHLVWAKVARTVLAEAPPTALAAPDLRGRVLSAGLPGPWGLRQHAADLVAVLDHLGVERAVLVGHSMGAFVAALVAADAPERVGGLALVDGGAPTTPAGDADPAELLEARLGSVVGRLRQTYANRDAYLAEWSAHPAFRDGIDRDTRAALLADLAGSGFAWRSSINAEAVRADAAELLADQWVRDALLRTTCPAVVLRAACGPLDQPEPSIPSAAVDLLVAARPHTTVVDVPDTNHSTIVLGQAGAEAIAAAVRTLL
jgi:lipase